MKTIKVLATSLMLLLAAGAGAQQTWNIGSPVATDVTATLIDSTLTISGTGKMVGGNWTESQIKYVEIEEGITIIGDGAFSYHRNLISVNLPETLKEMGRRAFFGCGLTSFTIPGSVEFLDTDLTDYCPLTKLVIECGEKPLMTEGGTIFSLPIGKTGLDTIFVGRHIIGSEGHRAVILDCSNTKSLIFGECVSALGNCRFDSLSIDKVLVLSTVPPQLDGSPLRYPKDVRSVVVPYGSGEAYRATPIWQDFNIVELPAPEEIIETPIEEGAFIEWQANEHATGYRLAIFADAAHTDTIRIVEFDAAGNVVNTVNVRAAGTKLSHKVEGLDGDTDYYYTLEALGVLSVVLSSQAGDFTTLGGVTGIDNAGVENIRPLPTAYYNAAGQRLTTEPDKGTYIIVYENGKTEKRIR
ncbi:MAG: leucine-rich repeat domain-containing protein [Prevotellaceae bacterium]|jgi:hypothetical protein|nr:leucine-rich repeat domain-containing protein [Prevotellaceae bacterium]